VVRQAVQPVACSILLVIVMLPVAAATCHLMCAGAAHAGEQTHHHHAAQAAVEDATGAVLVDTHGPCDHQAAVDARVSPHFKLTAPAIFARAAAASTAAAPAPTVSDITGPHRPPGSRSAPIPLRV